VLGFLSVATVLQDTTLPKAVVVSIPCWVFSPSRLHLHEYAEPPTTGFNPVLGFLSVATDVHSWDAVRDL